MERRDLLKMTGAGIGALSVSSLLATVAKAEADLQLDSTWDKTFPKSDKVDHAKVAFKNRYGISLAADLYQPKDASGKLAAIVISGPFGAVKEQSSGLYAQTMAERGFVTLAPAYPHLAQYRPDWAALGYASGTMKAIWDNVRGLDLLEDMEEVRTGGVGAIGHSLGGHNAIYTATFDARIAVVVSSCGFDSYQAYKDGDITSWTSSCYMPRLRDYALAAIPFDFHDMVAALAPRPFFASAPLYDDNFKWQSVDSVAAAASRVYALYGVEDRLSIAHPDCAHDFPLTMRERAYALFAQWL